MDAWLPVVVRNVTSTVALPQQLTIMLALETNAAGPEPYELP